jgi:hypothetical protein
MSSRAVLAREALAAVMPKLSLVATQMGFGTLNGDCL